MESQGRDIKLDEKRVEGYRNFATKLWNAARFLQMNGVGAGDSIAAPAAELPVNRWIIGEVVETLAKLDRAFDELRYDEMADAIYHFVWGTFCDWYVELIKGAFDDETKAVAAWAFDQILVMLHPLMPFITEELWSAMGTRPYELIVAKWPKPETQVDPHAKAEISALIDMISGIRTQRLDTGFRAADVIPVSPIAASESQLAVMNKYKDKLGRMARVRPAKIEIQAYDSGAVWSIEGVEEYEVTDADQTSFISAQFVLRDLVLLASTQGFIDVDAERSRLTNLAQSAEKQRDNLAGRLGNSNFVGRASPEAVEKARADLAYQTAEASRYRNALERLG
jgi:valyl-tRNA synthetase